MFKLVFVPDPRFPRNDLIGVDDTGEDSIIQVHLDEHDPDEDYHALLQRQVNRIYKFLLYDFEKDYHDSYTGFSETRNSKTACDYVRQLYRNGRIYAKEGVLVRRK